MTSEESKAEKPNREIFDMAMEKIQCSDPATAYHVGTSIDYDVSNFTSYLHRFIILCIRLIFFINFYLLRTLHFIYYKTVYFISYHFISSLVVLSNFNDLATLICIHLPPKCLSSFISHTVSTARYR